MADVMASTSVDLIIGIETIDTDQRLAVIHTIIGTMYTVFTIIATISNLRTKCLEKFLGGILKECVPQFTKTLITISKEALTDVECLILHGGRDDLILSGIQAK
jgi:hypothetical protein